jgi:hypothetical protein
MTIEETHEAIPPAYTQFIGEQLMEHLGMSKKQERIARQALEES